MNTDKKIKILVVVAATYKEDAEATLLCKKLAVEPLKQYYDVIALRAMTQHDVFEAVSAMQPDIIHFCGECSANGDFMFKNDDDVTSDWCSKGNLLRKITKVVDEVKLVYFNGTVKDSELAAAGGKIAFLVGMQQRGEAEISKKFVIPFYMVLGFGNPLGYAFGEVWKALPEEERKMVLRFRSNIDPDKYYLRTSINYVMQAADAH